MDQIKDKIFYTIYDLKMKNDVMKTQNQNVMQFHHKDWLNHQPLGSFEMTHF